MSAGEILGTVSIVVTLLLGILVFITNRRANRTSEKKLTLEEQQAADEREDGIAERRRVELERLYGRVEKLEEIVKQLQAADRKKQVTINEQADELERTNDILSDVRALFSKFVTRVEEAWASGKAMPTLTTEERRLLEDTIPRHTHLARGETP